MDRLTLLLSSLVLCLGLSACETTDISRRDIGTAGGAAAGALIGDAVTDSAIGTAGGAAAGAVIGGRVGERMWIKHPRASGTTCRAL
jgi:osmotically inducible lipoprotein OsmB